MSFLPKPKLFPANHVISPNTAAMRSQCLPLSTLSSKMYRTKQKTQLLPAATTNGSGRGCPCGLVHSKAPHLGPFLPLTLTFSSSEQRQRNSQCVIFLEGWTFSLHFLSQGPKATIPMSLLTWAVGTAIPGLSSLF